MGVAWWVILEIVAFNFVVFLGDLKFVYSFEDDRESIYNQGLLSKILVLLGLQLVWLISSIVPTDAMNVVIDGGLSIDVMWQLLYLTAVFFLLFPLPYIWVYIHAESDSNVSKVPAWRRALVLTGIVNLFAGSFLIIFYFSSWKYHTQEVVCVDSLCTVTSTVDSPEEFKINFIDFLIGTTALVGWVPFGVFAGVGLTSLPLAMVVRFLGRPLPKSMQEYSNDKKLLAEKATVLKTIGDALRNRQTSIEKSKGFGGLVARYKQRRLVNKYKQSIHVLECEYSQLQTSFKERGENPVKSGFVLTGGIIFIFLSLLWTVEIVGASLVPVCIPSFAGFSVIGKFLGLVNSTKIYFLGFFVYLIFYSYLMAVTFFGSMTFCLRIFCFSSFHPISPNKTKSSALLFYTATLVLASCAACAFTFKSFRSVISLGTAGLMIWDTQISHISSQHPFYQYSIFEWLFFCWALVACGLLLVYPHTTYAFDVTEGSAPKEIQKFLFVQANEANEKTHFGEQPKDVEAGRINF